MRAGDQKLRFDLVWPYLSHSSNSQLWSFDGQKVVLDDKNPKPNLQRVKLLAAWDKTSCKLFVLLLLCTPSIVIIYGLAERLRQALTERRTLVHYTPKFVYHVNYGVSLIGINPVAFDCFEGNA